MDPRFSIIGRRLEGIARIIGVTGAKGGIGKSMVSSTLALMFARSGRKTGLLDLDFTAPTDHVILGLEGLSPTEESGLEPPEEHGIRFMSVTHFTGERPVPLRGEAVTNALLELLAITRWGELDFLVIDMPPGLGDAALDAVRLIPRADYLVVANSSKVIRETVRRNLQLLTDLKAPILGIVENMKRAETTVVQDLADQFGVPFLADLPYDETLEDAVGDVPRLAVTPFAAAMRTLTDTLAERRVPDPSR
jgi:ATP-binding protein involved in chromosome partitioning